MMNIALILARSGSKRIPNKNMTQILGHPLIFYPISEAIRSTVFDEIIVSSDGKEIQDYALGLGVQIHKRSPELSNDYVTAFEVVKSIITEKFSQLDDDCTLTVMYGTSIFIKAENIQEMNERMSLCDMIFSATEFSFPPKRGFTLDGGRLKPVDRDAFLARSQDLEKWFHDVGQIYMAKLKYWKTSNDIYDGASKHFYIKPSEVQDIDTMDDLALATLKLELRK